MTNRIISQMLRQLARQLQGEGENIYRLRAYRTGADAVERLEKPLIEIYGNEGRKGLAALPHIGRSLAVTIEALLTSGQLATRKASSQSRSA